MCAVLSGLPTLAPRLLWTDFGTNLQWAPQDYPFLGDLAVEAQASPDHTVTCTGAVFIWRDCHLWRRAARGDLLCIPDYVGMQCTVLEELHAKQLGRHFGC